MWRLISHVSSVFLTPSTSRCLLESTKLHIPSRCIFTDFLSTLKKPHELDMTKQWAVVSVQSVRGKKRNHYQPSAWKRINKHGIHQKLYSESAIHVLWRRFLKGRHNLAPFERILKGTKRGKILP